MRQITSPRDVLRLGTILSVWAHPDDETFLAAGIMATAARNGQKVVCVTATKGEAGSQNLKKWPLKTLAQTRASELNKALQILGVKAHYWLGYYDGECEKADKAKAVGKLTDLIIKHQPDSILTFGPEGMTGHPDHQAVSRWCTSAAHHTKAPITCFHAVHTTSQYDRYLKDADAKLNIFFNIDQPPLKDAIDCEICYALPTDIRRLKRDALAAMPSQTEVLLKLFDKDFLDGAFANEYFVVASA